MFLLKFEFKCFNNTTELEILYISKPVHKSFLIDFNEISRTLVQIGNRYGQ